MDFPYQLSENPLGFPFDTRLGGMLLAPMIQMGNVRTLLQTHLHLMGVRLLWNTLNIIRDTMSTAHAKKHDLTHIEQVHNG